MKNLVDTEGANTISECGLRNSELKKLVDTETAARIWGIRPRTIQRWFEAGKLEGEFRANNRGGKGGMKLFVYIDDTSSELGVRPPAPRLRQAGSSETDLAGRDCPPSGPASGSEEPLARREALLGRRLASLRGGAPSLRAIGPTRPEAGAEPVGDSPHQEDGDHPPGQLPARRALQLGERPSWAGGNKAGGEGAFIKSDGEMGRSGDRETNRNKVHPGEPGCHVVTPIVNGEPVIERPEPLIPAESKTENLPAPIVANLPAIINDKVPSPKASETAYMRMALLNAWREKINGNGGLKIKITEEFLALYNSGLLLPNIFEKIKEISRSTLYNYDRAERLGGVPALVPQYPGAAGQPITDYEKYILLNCLLHQNRLKIGTAIKFTKTFLVYKKIESPSSESKLRRFAEEFRATNYPAWVKAREGAKALNDKCLPYAERDWSLLSVGEGLVADGHRLNFLVINPFTGKPCRATIVLFWDWKSAYPLGWEIMIEENIQCIASALRNAILTLGKIPKWLLIDNGKAFKAKVFTSEIELEDGILYGMFATLGIHTHFSQAYNAQEKPLERFWGTFNNWFERLMDSYTGASIEDKPAWTKRNEKEAQAKHKNHVPRIEYVQEALYKWVDFYASQPSRGRAGKTPGEIFQAEKGPGVDPAELYHLLLIKEKMRVHRNGVTFNNWHYYDEALSNIISSDVVGKYSLSDYSKIFCFYKNQFVCVARPIERVHPMISESEAPQNYEAVKRVSAIKNRIKRGAKNLLTLIEGGGGIDSDTSFQRSPDVAAVVKAIEGVQETPKMISAFSDDHAASVQVPAAGEPETERPWFRDEYERYRWVMQQQVITEDDRGFIDDFRARSLLYKNIIFTDQKILDQKVISSSREAASDEGSLCNRS